MKLPDCVNRILKPAGFEEEGQQGRSHWETCFGGEGEATAEPRRVTRIWIGREEELGGRHVSVRGGYQRGSP